MPKVIGSSSANNLQITIPVRGEKNWDELIENSCFQRISDHSHTGNGDGAKIDTDALEDNAVTAVKITDGVVSNAKLDSATQTSIGTISTNTSNISTNTSNIATNTSNIGTNTSNISTNTSNISTNTSNISTNTANVATNTTNIATNTNRALGSISDVSSSAPTDGQVLAYNNTSGEWEPTTGAGGGATALNGLSDVTITGTPSNDSFLRYDSTSSAFKNESVTIPSALNDLSLIQK